MKERGRMRLKLSSMPTFRSWNEKGQATIFIIVAIAIIIIIALSVLFFPRIDEIFGGEISPNNYLRECVEPIVKDNVDLLAKQGGYRNPEGFVLHGGEKIKYLCYTDDYYETCVVQQPMIKQHFEKELSNLVGNRGNECVKNLIEEYKSRGYKVVGNELKTKVSIVPGSIIITFTAPLSITKETTQNFDGFDINLNSEMYGLLLTAESIIDFETGLGDSASELYLQFYPDLKIEKTKLSEGTTIYKLSNVITGESFTFASRSLAWPAGYGLEEI